MRHWGGEKCIVIDQKSQSQNLQKKSTLISAKNNIDSKIEIV